MSESPSTPPAASPSAAWRSENHWNLPNSLTLLRVLAVPLFVVFMMWGTGAHLGWRAAALAVFLLAMITDFFDGHLARRRGQITSLGKMADPLADKALVGAALITLSLLGDVPWWVTVVMLARELIITVWRFTVIRTRIVPASSGGKVKTVLQTTALAMFILPLAPVVGQWYLVVAWVVMAGAVVVAVATGIDYFVKASAAKSVPTPTAVAAPSVSDDEHRG